MATAVRALIMLVVLVGGPCAWVYYGPLPDNAQRLVDRFVASAKEVFERGQPVLLPSGDAAKTAVAPPFSPAGGTAPPAAKGPAANGPTASFAQRVAPMLAELKRLGVVAYDLEPWGADRRMFRFRCEMPLVAGGQATEQFEAIAADPQRSVEQVASQVASWQASRAAGLP